MDEQENNLPQAEDTSTNTISSDLTPKPDKTISDQEVDDLLAELDDEATETTTEVPTDSSFDTEMPLDTDSEIGLKDPDLSSFDPDEDLTNTELPDEDTPVDTPVPEDIPAPPQPDSSGTGTSNKKNIIILTAITAILLLILGGAIWWFFLRDSSQTTPTPTPTPSIAVNPTDEPTAQTHLECRFGLCVEVPGAGNNFCSSSFDCEQGGAQLTATPTSGAPTPGPTGASTPTAAPTTEPTSAPTATGTLAPTKVPTATSTPTPTSAESSTVTPTPLAASLPESGTVETTLFVTFLSILFMATGIVAYRKR
ncbi:hypothetical protein GW793_02950 [bacterium]|uniref:Gram-positive cocci surface proteins LPxTG domain-containing protein n=2 Tax=Katanobacteria TaxID=422282 RepID=A0A2M7X3X2_UNCKA|nr:hypothetical protein [bacterium]PIP56438.1 MAG: hypothetical protein COX05_02940 [candidate division WWE3 bacterium CG22_combo_CG10-13_8_21_14_all_39_12]PJA40681.1 MAG: hypothetical protein CO179_01605 [candidate division WWE3 bacterium CG_4_9_14_3_um_filter_39_7]